MLAVVSGHTSPTSWAGSKCIILCEQQGISLRGRFDYGQIYNEGYSICYKYIYFIIEFKIIVNN